MASDLESLVRRTRQYLDENLELRFKRATTTDAGATDGTTVISTDLTELDDHWNGCECINLSDDPVSVRIVEDFTNSTGTLMFTNNPFPSQVLSNVSIELGESGAFSHYALRQYVIDAVNTLASILPSSALRDYIRRQSTSSNNGAVNLPGDMLDIVSVFIDGKPAVPISPQESARIISGEDSFLNINSNRFLYYIRGKDTSQAELLHGPQTDATVTFDYIPFAGGFTNGQVEFPDMLHSAVAMYAASLAYESNGDSDYAERFQERTVNHLKTFGIKAQKLFKMD